MRRVIIAGGQGFIGSYLTPEFLNRGYEVIILRRSATPDSFSEQGVKYVQWDAVSGKNWSPWADGATAVINLAGENISTGRWSSAKKQKILESRIRSVEAISEGISLAGKKPEAVIQSSATGFYGSRGDEVLTEGSESGEGFLADVCRQWEDAASVFNDLVSRKIIIRTSPVLAYNGGPLAKLIPLYRKFLGGYPGNGENWFSWIHIKDEVNAIVHLVENKKCSGVYNLASPLAVRAEDFYNQLGKALKRPAWFHTPSHILKLVFGEMAEEMILADTRVMPERLLKSGFEFSYIEIKDALEDIVKNIKG